MHNAHAHAHAHAHAQCTCTCTMHNAHEHAVHDVHDVQARMCIRMPMQGGLPAAGTHVHTHAYAGWPTGCNSSLPSSQSPCSLLECSSSPLRPRWRPPLQPMAMYVHAHACMYACMSSSPWRPRWRPPLQPMATNHPREITHSLAHSLTCRAHLPYVTDVRY